MVADVFEHPQYDSGHFSAEFRTQFRLQRAA
jgi:hypothetical protein